MKGTTNKTSGVGVNLGKFMLGRVKLVYNDHLTEYFAAF